MSSHLSQGVNLNTIPLGTQFQRWAQDPTKFTGGVIPDSDPSIPQIYKDKGFKFDGSKALNSVHLRPYPGYGSINFTTGGGSSNYHSLQISLNRKFTRDFTYSLAYTWGRAMDTANGDTEFLPNYNIRGIQYRRASFDRRQTFSVNYIYNLPRLSPKLGDHWLAKGVFDGWELSGITQLQTGSPSELGFGIEPATGRSITGSPDIGARFVLTGDPTGPRTRDQWFDPSVFKLPEIGTDGTGSRTYLENPGLNVTDLSVFKNFALPGGDNNRRIQIRFEFFNAFNHTNFSSFFGTMTWNLASNWSDYTAKSKFDPQWVRNTRTGVNPGTGRLGRALGEVSGQPAIASRRVIQMAAKIYF